MYTRSRATTALSQELLADELLVLTTKQWERVIARRRVLRGRPNSVPAGDLKEVWFAGVHSDVGGGYPVSADPRQNLWKFSLAWMLREAETAGLLVNSARKAKALGADPDPNAPRHESLHGWWRLAEFIPKKGGRQRPDGTWRQAYRVNLFRGRQPNRGDTVHWSIVARDGYGERVPGAVVEH
jgi:hypothetical protein